MGNRFSPAFSGTALKRLACVSMLLDHIGASCLEAGLLADGTSPAWLSALDAVLRCVGRLAFPIYCFLLVEGFLHTHSVRRYAGRLALFAVVSEVPFDWAFFGTTFSWERQNVYWTLLLGLAAMALLQRMDSGGTYSWHGAACALGCAFAAELLRTDYGAIGVLLIVALYYAHSDRPRQCLWGALLTLYEPPAPLAFLPIWFYNGERGKCAKWEKWAYYAFYPVHIGVLGVITNCVIKI